jgi:AcrR family transcriptional regulator
MTREEILEAAAQIFSQKGFHGASMQDIAEAVQLQKASLYHHVASKQEILLEILDDALDLLIERVSIVAALPISPQERLRQAMQTYLQILAEHRALAAVLLLEYRSLEPEYHHRHLPRRDRFEALWRDLIREGAEAGAFHCEHCSLAARALLGVMNWTITWYRPDGPLSPAEIADQFAELFLKGLIVREVAA